MRVFAGMTTWGWVWLMWMVYFALAEGIALFNHRPGDTFSAHVWWWMGAGWSWQRVIVAVFLAWLAYHFVKQGLEWVPKMG